MYDAATVIDDSAIDPAVATPLRWPPPSLEALQGLAWRAAALLAAGTTIMTAPLLLSVATTQSFWSIGLFGSSWWVSASAALIGLLILLAGMERLTRLLVEGSRAARRGHDWATIAYVVSDARHDAGFLLQGARQYASVPERDRRMLLAARVTSVACYVLALFWIPASFALGVAAAGRGLIASGAMLVTFILFPAGMLLIAAVMAHVFDANTTRSVIRTWRRDDRCEARLLDEVSDWRADRATRLIHLTTSSRRTAPARALAGMVVLLAMLIPIPVATLALATAMGPVLAQLAIPRLDATAGRIARAAMLEPYALPTNDSMTALQAGEALHALALTGSTTNRSPVERAPVRRYDAWPRESKPATLPNVESFGTQLMPRAAALTPDEIRYLARIMDYPAGDDFARVARARSADIAGGRWHTDRLATISVLELPVARFGGLRDAAQFHTARAIYQLSQGDAVAAETTLREIISVGLLLARESPTFIDVLVGTSIVANGAAALQSFYTATGRIAEADALRRPALGIETMEEITRGLRADGDLDTGLRRAMAMTTNGALPRGMRWEGLIAIQLGAGCLNPHTAVFGRGSEYELWLETTRSALVRYPSEAALFELSMRGPVAPAHLHGRADAVERLLRLTLANGGAAGTCAALFTGLTNRD